MTICIFSRTDFLLTFSFGKSGRPGVDFTGSQGTITTVPSQPGVFSPIGAVYPGRSGPKWWKWAHLGPKMGENWCFGLISNSGVDVRWAQPSRVAPARWEGYCCGFHQAPALWSVPSTPKYGEFYIQILLCWAKTPAGG